MATAQAVVTCINGAQLPRLRAAAGTDIANGTGNPKRSRYAFNAPLVYLKLQTACFRRCRAAFRCASGYDVDLDQAGLILVWPRPGLANPSAEEPCDEGSAPSYVMAGVERFRGRVMRSCVENVEGKLDWSTWPLDADAPGRRDCSRVAVEMIRSAERLVVVFILEGPDGTQQRILFRTMSWCFPDDVLWVGFFAARPDWDGITESSLEIDIEELEVQSETDVMKIV